MATNVLDFSASIGDWVKSSEQRMTAVFREATKLTVRKAQKRIPVVTGFARASIRASTSSMPQIDPALSNPLREKVAYDFGEITAVIAGARLGETIYIGWTANYVWYLELGHSKQAPAGFVGLAAAEWQNTVNDVVAKLKARVESAVNE